jgi:hypothetical protein
MKLSNDENAAIFRLGTEGQLRLEVFETMQRMKMTSMLFTWSITLSKINEEIWGPYVIPPGAGSDAHER